MTEAPGIWAYSFDHVPSEDEIAEVSDRWRPYRSLAVSYLFARNTAKEPERGVPSRRLVGDTGSADGK